MSDELPPNDVPLTQVSLTDAELEAVAGGNAPCAIHGGPVPHYNSSNEVCNGNGYYARDGARDRG